ncbi:hypothetical protein NHX12_019539 [Muraenolepis orangiensis]|uniref:Uncharacterized protein n=1 Tax=Muraenolepis orangiensis TaxID=630683 RepID=A0A9Q0ETL4_9TELE|nr:hypothetical protein NHX12_019539 [Muraenolepis orangiensis]
MLVEEEDVEEESVWRCWRRRRVCGDAGGGGECVEMLEEEESVWRCWRRRRMCGDAGGGGESLEMLETEESVCRCWRRECLEMLEEGVSGDAGGGSVWRCWRRECLEMLVEEESVWRCWRRRVSREAGSGECLEMPVEEESVWRCWRRECVEMLVEEVPAPSGGHSVGMQPGVQHAEPSKETRLAPLRSSPSPSRMVSSDGTTT